MLTRKSKENISDTDILDNYEKDLLPEDTEQNQLVSLLAKMNENMATMSESLRELHDKRRHVVSADHGDHTTEPANKAAKTAENDPADLVLSTSFDDQYKETTGKYFRLTRENCLVMPNRETSNFSAYKVT